MAVGEKGRRRKRKRRRSLMRCGRMEGKRKGWKKAMYEKRSNG